MEAFPLNTFPSLFCTQLGSIVGMGDFHVHQGHPPGMQQERGQAAWPAWGQEGRAWLSQQCLVHASGEPHLGRENWAGGGNTQGLNTRL